MINFLTKIFIKKFEKMLEVCKRHDPYKKIFQRIPVAANAFITPVNF